MPDKEIGSTGLAVAVGGQIEEELHRNLSGRKAIETWRDMKDNDAVVGAILLAIDMLIRQVDWKVEAGEAKQKDADFVESCMEDMSMSWGDFISEAMSMITFGFSYHEIVYKKRQGPQKPGSPKPSSRFKDGKVGWRKIPMRAQESLDHWEFDDEGGVKSFVQRHPQTFKEIEIPIEKGLLFRTTSLKNNPEGRSMLRAAYASWYRKHRLQAIEGTGIERDLAGFPVFWVPAEVLASDDVDAKKTVQGFRELGENIRRDKQEYMIMPLAFDERGNKAYDFTLTASSGSRTFDLNTTIGRYNKEIAMSVLADFILLGHENVGSFALSSDKTDLFAVAMGTLLDSIQDVLNRFLIPRLFELNGMPTDKMPRIVHEDLAGPDLTELGQFLQTLSAIGVTMFPDEEFEDWLRTKAGLPPKSEEAKKAQEEAKDEEGSDATSGGDGGGDDQGGSSGSEEWGDFSPTPDNPVDLSGL